MILNHIDSLILELKGYRSLGFKTRAEAKSAVQGEQNKRSWKYYKTLSGFDQAKLLFRGSSNLLKPKTLTSVASQMATGLDIPGMIDAGKTIYHEPQVLKNPKEVMNLAIQASPGNGPGTIAGAIMQGTLTASKYHRLNMTRKSINTGRDLYPHLTDPAYAY